jgi:DNA-binding MarR family transcriptional regulator
MYLDLQVLMLYCYVVPRRLIAKCFNSFYQEELKMDIKDEEFFKKFIIDSVRIINHTSDTFIKSEISRGELTTPQLNVMMELVSEDGLSLKELSKRLNLSHSTVSGIIDRLEARELVVRRQDSSDGRFSRIFTSGRVNDSIKNKLFQRYAPFINAIQKAKPEEKVKIFEGFSILSRLLKELE